MKKALVILLALSMVFAAFADEPAVTNAIAEFKGDASVTWGVKFDGFKTGFKNATSGSVKFNIFGQATKSTEGEGIWGELAIKLDSDDGFQYKGGTTWNNVNVKVSTAKIHINDMFAISILSGSNAYGEYKPTLAVYSDNGHIKVDNVGGSVTDGITAELTLKDPVPFGLNIDFRSLPGTDQYTNKYGIGTSVSATPMTDLNVKAGFGIDFFETSGAMKYGYSASVDYKLAFGEESPFYLKPQIGFAGKSGSNELAAAVLFGWGSENQDTNIKWVSKKVSDGVSVAAKVPLAASPAIELCIGAWDSVLIAENLKVGAQCHLAFGNAFAFKTGAIEFAYDTGLGVKPSVAFAYDNGGDLSTTANPWDDAMKVFVGCDFTGFVANTTFTAAWESGKLNQASPDFGTLNLTAKISF